MNPSNPIQKCDESIDLIEQGLATKSEVMQAMAFKQKLMEIARAISHRFEQAAIGWIEKNGEIEEGEKRWFVGTVTKRSCLNVEETARTILESHGPDALARVLSSGCFKAAATMELLGEDAMRHFEVRVEKDLKDGKPRKKLKSTDPKRLGESDE